MTFLSASTDTNFYTGPTTNQIPLEPETSLILLKSLLKSAGWTVTAAGTGTGGTAVSGANSDQFASGSTLYARAQAWFVITHPVSSRSFTFQHANTSATSINWRIKYSPGGFAVTASQTVNQTPGPITGSEETILIGGGTDAAPTFAQFFNATTQTRRFHAMADNASPYGFWAAEWPLGGGATALTSMVFDPLLSGSYNVLDTDPYVMYFRFGNSGGNNPPFRQNDIGSTTIGPVAWYRRGLSGSSAQVCPALSYNDAAAVLVPGGITTNPFSGADEVFPLPYGRAATLGGQSGWKGYGTILKWAGQFHNCGDTLSVASTRDHIVISHCAVSWSGEVAHN